MRRQNRMYLVLAAVFMAICILLPCCVSAAHTAEHACCHYSSCRLCQQFDAGELLAVLALLILFGCIFLRSRTEAHCNSARHCLVPVTLISQSIQMND